MSSPQLKSQVQQFWDRASCGEDLLLRGTDERGYREQMRERYALEPYIERFAEFASSRGQAVLEVGVGLGADHQRFAEAGAQLTGIDLTPRAIEHTRRRFAHFGLVSDLLVGDAENLPFSAASFDRVYSWGVLHHSPDTQRAIDEVWRVLRPGGTASIMIYHKYSLVGAMLWIRYALVTGKPGRTLSDIYAHHLESPGTKAYTLDEARELFRRFSGVRVETVLTHGDLLESGAGQRHRGALLAVARMLWPRPLLRRLFPRLGLFMLIRAER
jgi:ubiquinone/menaquinone biosynthesis C-methylase UbiE